MAIFGKGHFLFRVVAVCKTGGVYGGKRGTGISFAQFFGARLIVTYGVVSNCHQSRINAWSHLVAKGGTLVYVSIINTRFCLDCARCHGNTSVPLIRRYANLFAIGNGRYPSLVFLS